MHRIAVVCDWYPPRVGGIERQVESLAQRLAQAGCKVTVISPMAHGGPAAQGVRLLPVAARLLPGAALMWAPSAFRRLGAAVRSEAFDVVHVHGSIISPTAFAALYHAQRAGLPAVSTTHSILGGWTRVFAMLDRWSHWTRWPVVFSGVSARVAGELQQLIAPRRAHVLPNAIHPAEWRITPRSPSDVIAISSVMRLVPRKRGAALLNALGTAAAELPGRRVVLRLAGDGPDRVRLERIARTLPPNVTVQFLGAIPITGVKALLAGSHFFVLASKLEAFGIAALEARAAGLPVVAMAEGGVSEFISHGREGLLADNDAALATHILQLCRDDALRNGIADHNRSAPVACAWDRVLPDYFAAYGRARELALGVRAAPGKIPAVTATVRTA